MPPPKRFARERLSHFAAKLSPRKAIKRVASIALSPVKARPQKKNRDENAAVGNQSLAVAHN